MSESSWTGWELDRTAPPATPDVAGARASQEAYRRGWEDGRAAAARAEQHPYKRAALMGAAAGYSYRVGIGGALLRVLGILAVVVGGAAIGLTIAAAVFPQSTQLVMLASMGGAVWYLMRRLRRHDARSPRRLQSKG